MNRDPNDKPAGGPEGALAAVIKEVAWYRSLYDRQPDEFAADLVSSLNNMGIVLSNLGRLEEALQATGEAVKLLRSLYVRQPDEFAADLARSLGNLGNRLNKIGRREEALLATMEAVELLRSLYAKQPDDVAGNLAGNLSNLGNRLHNLGRREAALQATEEAVALFRRLYARQPDDFAADLAKSLGNLGPMLSALGRREAALQATEEAIDLYRRLYARQPDDFAANLANGLINLGSDLSDLGRREKALQAAEEAVDLYRRLYARQPDAFAANLAISLTNLGNRYSKLGRREEALQVAGEAVALYRSLYDSQPDAFAPDLASCLNSLGTMLGELGRYEKALQASEKAVNLYRSLHAKLPGAFAPNLANSLDNLGVLLSLVSQREEALKATGEAVELYRSLHAMLPDAFADELANSLTNLGIDLSNLGRREEALQASEEAVNLYRHLYAEQPDAFAAELANSLTNLGIDLSDLGQLDVANILLHEAGLCLLRQRTMDPNRWCQSLRIITRRLDSAASLRHIHLALLQRIADLRRLSYFDSAAGGAFIQLQAVVVADLWGKLAAASHQDPALLDDAIPVLLSALQSPDLMRWLADNQRTSAAGRALAQAESEYHQANAALAELNTRLRAGPSDQNLPAAGARQAQTPEQQAADQADTVAAGAREVASRAALEDARKALATEDPAFASAYEVPPVPELRAMLDYLRVAATSSNAPHPAPAALLCFLELPAHGEQAARLVGVLLSSGSKQVRQIEFPGLLELALQFQHYKPLGQRSSATLRRQKDDSDADPGNETDTSAPPTFDALFRELEQRWWVPLTHALGAELVQLGVLHVCSHGLAHQLPYSQVRYLDVGGNLQLFQWPGLPFLRLAYRQGRTRPATAPGNEEWQIAHDCAWTEATPLPMVAVEAHLLREIIRDAGHRAEAVDDPAHLAPGGRGLVVCSHGTRAQGVRSAVHLAKGKLTTEDVMRRKIAPEIALIPACHAADTADDHAHNALGVAAGFLLAGAKVVVGSIKAVPDTLMPWFSALLMWYVVHGKLGLHAASVRARQDFGNGAFPEDFQKLVRANLAAGLGTLHPGAEEEQQLNAKLPPAALIATINAWPWYGLNRDALVPANGLTLTDMKAASSQLASNAFKPSRHGNVAGQMKEMAAFLVVFGLG